MSKFTFSRNFAIPRLLFFAATSLVNVAHAATVAILVSGPEYHHQADVCTAAQGVFRSFNHVHVLMERKATSLYNFAGVDVSAGCAVTHTPRLESLKTVFNTLTTADDVVLFLVGLGNYRVFSFPTDSSEKEVTRDFRFYKMLHYSDFHELVGNSVYRQLVVVADFEQSSSFFPANSLPANALAITSPSNVATHCFQAPANTNCRSHRFLGTILRQQGTTLNSMKSLIRALYAAGIDDIAVHSGDNVTLSDSTIYKAVVPWLSPIGTFSDALGTQCPATGVGLCYSWASGGTARYAGLVAAGAVEAAHRKKEEERFMEISRCDAYHIADGEVSPIETEEGRYECLQEKLDADTPFQIANTMEESDYEKCTRNAVNVVSICGAWSPYSLRFSKLLHAMCAAEGMTMRKVIKQTELAFGTLCDATEYPDNSKLAYDMGMAGFLFVGVFFAILKPIDAWLQLRSSRR